MPSVGLTQHIRRFSPASPTRSDIPRHSLLRGTNAGLWPPLLPKQGGRRSVVEDTSSSSDYNPTAELSGAHKDPRVFSSEHQGRSKPRILDLFCGAGGAAMGYARAGFEVVGVDIEPQPNYPFSFWRGDALEMLERRGGGWHVLSDFDAIHASPPCQAHSTIAKQQRERRPGEYEHPDLVAPTRELLQATSLPYVIENVPGAPLVNPVQLCGSSFQLDLRRHRLFECSFPIMVPPCHHGWQTPRFRSLDKRRNKLKSTVPVHGGSQLASASVVGVHGHHNYAGERELREAAMDIDWMSPYELTQAIPPAYTEHIGQYLRRHLDHQPREPQASDRKNEVSPEAMA